MKEAILRVMAILAIYVGAKDATQLIAARGANVFGPFFATIFVDARLFASSSVWRTAWAESRRSAVDARRVVRIEQERGATAAWRMSLPASTDCGMK